MFEIRGEGTLEISQVNVGENLDIMGTLGHGFTIKELEEGKKVVCVGGGIGVPPMHSLAEVYKEKAIVISGFKTAGIAILQDDIKSTGAKAILCTDDGTAGVKGFVTNALKEVLASENIDIVYACGATLMSKAVAEICNEMNVECSIT